jgi:hypothetical protein
MAFGPREGLRCGLPELRGMARGEERPELQSAARLPMRRALLSDGM